MFKLKIVIDYICNKWITNKKWIGTQTTKNKEQKETKTKKHKQTQNMHKNALSST